MAVGRQTLYFFPDRVFIFDSGRVGAVSYPNLQVAVSPTRFIEDARPPGDAKVVDKTWKYVNKRGGPDKRFKDNRELPVCLYEEVTLCSATGLNEVIQLSRCGPGDRFARAITMLAARVPPEIA